MFQGRSFEAVPAIMPAVFGNWKDFLLVST